MNRGKNLLHQILFVVLGIISMSIASYIGLNALDMMTPLLRRESFSAAASIRIVVGYILLVVISMAWLGFLMVIFRYYHKIRRDSLLARFLRVTAIEFFVLGGLELVLAILKCVHHLSRSASLHLGLAGVCAVAGSGLLAAAVAVRQSFARRSLEQTPAEES